jgi:hypothetical protein
MNRRTARGRKLDEGGERKNHRILARNGTHSLWPMMHILIGIDQ